MINPTLAHALALLIPFVVAALSKAQASNRVRTVISLLLVAALTVGTVLGDQYPDQFEAIAMLVGELVAIAVASYKVVDTLMGEERGLNDALLPKFGIK